eukprot:Skav232252  [mRNA]  locus=scaffold273:118815:119489:- [translate_table: standard]
MGYPGGSVHSCSFEGKNLCGSKGLPVGLQNLTCEGTEDRLSQCQWEAPDKECLDHSKDSLVQCNSDESGEGSLRLVDGDGNVNSGAGRLEVLHNDRWSSVCSEGFTQGSALVACKAMGFSATGHGPFGCRSYGTNWCSDAIPELQLACDGSEANISDCYGRAGRDVCPEAVVLQCRGGVSSKVPKLVPKSSKIPPIQRTAGCDPLFCPVPSWRRKQRGVGYFFL